MSGTTTNRQATTLLAQQGGQAQDSWANYRGLPAPAQAATYLGSTAGQLAWPAEEEFESGTDSDTSSDDGAEDLDFSDVPRHLTEAQQAVWVFLGYRHQTTLETIYEETSSQNTTYYPTGVWAEGQG